MYELYLIALAVNLLACVGKEAVYHVLELCLGTAHLGSAHLVVGIARCEELYDAVAHVDLIVEVSFLQTVYLPVELCLHARVGELLQKVAVEQRAVERTYDVKLDVGGVFGHELYLHALGGTLWDYLSSVDGTEHHGRMVDDGALAHPVDAAEDVDIGLKRPDDVLAPFPQSLYLYALYVISSFFHKSMCFVYIANIDKNLFAPHRRTSFVAFFNTKDCFFTLS